MFTHSYRPNFECVRPSPDSLTPPHEHWQAPWLNMWSLIHTMPASSSRATRSPLLRSDVHTEAPRPKSESLARPSASSSESTTMIGSTGPKISSRMIRISQDDHRVLSAQLEHAALQSSRALLADVAADFRRAGEEDLGHARADQRWPRARSVDHADEPLGNAGAFEHTADALADQRRQR